MKDKAWWKEYRLKNRDKLRAYWMERKRKPVLATKVEREIVPVPDAVFIPKADKTEFKCFCGGVAEKTPRMVGGKLVYVCKEHGGPLKMDSRTIEMFKPIQAADEAIKNLKIHKTNRDRIIMKLLENIGMGHVAKEWKKQQDLDILP